MWIVPVLFLSQLRQLLWISFQLRNIRFFILISALSALTNGVLIRDWALDILDPGRPNSICMKYYIVNNNFAWPRQHSFPLIMYKDISFHQPYLSHRSWYCPTLKASPRHLGPWAAIHHGSWPGCGRDFHVGWVTTEEFLVG